MYHAQTGWDGMEGWGVGGGGVEEWGVGTVSFRALLLSLRCSLSAVMFLHTFVALEAA